MGDVGERIQKRGWVSMTICACGAGALLIAARNAMMRAGRDWSSQALFVAQDIDRTAALMCYLQAVTAWMCWVCRDCGRPILHMRSLVASGPTWQAEQDICALYLSPVWGYRTLWEQIRRCARASPASEPEAEAHAGIQLTLFERNSMLEAKKIERAISRL